MVSIKKASGTAVVTVVLAGAAGIATATPASAACIGATCKPLLTLSCTTVDGECVSTSDEGFQVCIVLAKDDDHQHTQDFCIDWGSVPVIGHP